MNDSDQVGISSTVSSCDSQRESSAGLPFASLLPKCRSKVVYVLVMASCAHTIGEMIGKVIMLCHPQIPLGYQGPMAPGTGVGEEVFCALIFAPVYEGLILAAMIEVIRLLRMPVLSQIIFPALVMCAMHMSGGVPFRALIVAPMWLIFAYSYLDWRRISWKAAFFMMLVIHSAANSPVVLDFVVSKTSLR